MSIGVSEQRGGRPPEGGIRILRPNRELLATREDVPDVIAFAMCLACAMPRGEYPVENRRPYPDPKTGEYGWEPIGSLIVTGSAKARAWKLELDNIRAESKR